MKFLITVSAAALFFSTCNSQGVKEKAVSPMDDTIQAPIKTSINAQGSTKSIKIVNTSFDTLWYYVSLQIWADNHWAEIINDINPKAPDRTAYPIQLFPGKDTLRNCDLSATVPVFLKRDTAKFNFKVSYGKGVDSIKNFVETEVFSL